MSKPNDFQPGARVLWAGTEYTIWSLHAKSGMRWISRDGRKPVEARLSNLELVAPAAAAVAGKVTPIRSAHPAPRKISEADKRTITAAIMTDATDHNGLVSPNRVRVALTGPDGTLTVPPRALASMYSGLAARGVIRSLGYDAVNDDTRGGNAGKPMRVWQWVGQLAGIA